MATGQKRTDKQLKTPDAGIKKARKDAGPKYLRSSMSATPAVSKTNGFGRKA